MKLRKIKKAQEVKTRNSFPCPRSKKAQEEIVGFGVILILIAIIFIVILGIRRNNTEQVQTIEDAESLSFLNAMLETSTACEDKGDLVTVKNLAFECLSNNLCDNGLGSCEVLNESIEEILDASWDAGGIGSKVKAYEFQIVSNEGMIINSSKGKIDDANNFKGASQDYVKSSGKINFYIKVYY